MEKAEINHPDHRSIFTIHPAMVGQNQALVVGFHISYSSDSSAELSFVSTTRRIIRRRHPWVDCTSSRRLSNFTAHLYRAPSTKVSAERWRKFGPGGAAIKCGNTAYYIPPLQNVAAPLQDSLILQINNFGHFGLIFNICGTFTPLT